MWSPAQGHAFVNSVKNPKMKETYMQALKDGTYQSLYMPQPEGYGGSREEWMHGAPAGSMTGPVQLPQGPAAPAAAYQVVAGDTLGEIAAAHGTDVGTLLGLNPHLAAQDAGGHMIHVGQQVALPGGVAAQTGAARPGRWAGGGRSRRAPAAPAAAAASPQASADFGDLDFTEKELARRELAADYEARRQAKGKKVSQKRMDRLKNRGRLLNPFD
jgi:LysM repeat protein